MKHPRTIAAAALLLAACGENPTAPPLATDRLAPSAARFSASEASAASELTSTIVDVRERLLPLLDNRVAADRMDALMTEVQTAVNAGDAAGAHRLLLDARLVADPNGDGSAGDLGDPANVAVLRLMLDNLTAATGS